jgi:hypothetical protein
LDGKGNLLALLCAFQLMRRGGPKRSVKSNVGRVFAGRARLDVAAALALGVRARAPAAAVAGDLI